MWIVWAGIRKNEEIAHRFLSLKIPLFLFNSMKTSKTVEYGFHCLADLIYQIPEACGDCFDLRFHDFLLENLQLNPPIVVLTSFVCYSAYLLAYASDPMFNILVQIGLFNFLLDNLQFVDEGDNYAAINALLRIKDPQIQAKMQLRLVINPESDDWLLNQTEHPNEEIRELSKELTQFFQLP